MDPRATVLHDQEAELRAGLDVHVYEQSLAQLDGSRWACGASVVQSQNDAPAHLLMQANATGMSPEQ
jgi:hypothetical protein